MIIIVAIIYRIIIKIDYLYDSVIIMSNSPVQARPSLTLVSFNFIYLLLLTLSFIIY